MGAGMEILLGIRRLGIYLEIQRGRGMFLLMLHAMFVVFFHMR
jgi:hypothetical protein